MIYQILMRLIQTCQENYLYFSKKKILIQKYLLPSEIGINIYEKVKYLKIILKKLLQCYFVSFLKLSDYHFII